MVMDAEALLRKVERFLFDEAELLDTWKLKEWEALFTDDGRYNIPPLNAENGLVNWKLPSVNFGFRKSNFTTCLRLNVPLG